MERYGAQLEADLQQVYGLELGLLWRNRRWKRLLRLVDNLPRNSRFAAAVANDEDHVRAVIKATEGQPKTSSAPSLADYTLESELLMEVVDLLQSNIHAVLAGAGAKGLGKIKPRRRPETAYQDVQLQMAQESYEKVRAKIMRGRQGPKVDP